MNCLCKQLRLISLLLACLLLLGSLISCGNDTNNPEGSTSQQSTASDESETADAVEEALTAIRAEVDWGGNDFGYLYSNRFGIAEEVEAVANMNESSGSGVINNAVWERNSLFEEYGNLTFVLIPVDSDNLIGNVQREVQAGTGDFQLVAQPTSYTASLATTGVLYNYLDLDIDYDQAWWDAGTLDFALDGRVFFMNGPFNIVDDDVTYLMMFNKSLHTEYGLANPYDLVRSGDWTMAKFRDTVQDLSSDNGDGKWDAEDTYGYAAGGSMDTFFYAADLRFVNNSQSMETPELAMDTSDMERAVNMLAMARDIVQNNNTTFSGDGMFDMFLNNRAFYYTEAASYLRSLNASMESEYGVIPVPKYDKNQKTHTSWSHSVASTLSMPTTVNELDTDALSDVLELYAILSEKLVRPAYYDTMLTTRNVRDADSAEMLEIIFNNRIYDMAMYFGQLGMGGIFADSVRGVDKFVSTYERAAGGFDKRISQILKDLNDSET